MDFMLIMRGVGFRNIALVLCRIVGVCVMCGDDSEGEIELLRNIGMWTFTAWVYECMLWAMGRSMVRLHGL